MRTAERRRGFRIGVVVGALTLALAGCKVDPGQPARDRIVWDHNGARAYVGLAFLSTRASVAANAQQAAERMRDESGSTSCVLRHTPSQTMYARYPDRMWGENIGCYVGCAGAARSVTPEFLRSATHRGNILNDSFSEFGVGASCNGKYLFVVVQFTS